MDKSEKFHQAREESSQTKKMEKWINKKRESGRRESGCDDAALYVRKMFSMGAGNWNHNEMVW